jgi:lipoprotein-releasing system ATP-binding protein
MSSALPHSEPQSDTARAGAPGPEASRFARSAADTGPAVSARNVSKTYVGGDGRPLRILDGVDLDVAAGEAVSVIGRSGSGKSTLLQMLGGLDEPSVGEVAVGGRPLARMAEEELARLRAERIGFVFQFHHLLREFTALENVMMPQLILGVPRARAQARAEELLESVGLTSRLTHVPSQLSGGEQQRVAVARALANRPLVLLADEPSGNLDPDTAESLHDLFFQVVRDEGAALVLVTHDLTLAARADRVLRLAAGALVPAHGEDPGLLE